MVPASLVVGIGSVLQGLDRFGPAVIERLQARADLPEGTTLLDAATDLLGCLDRFAAFRHVILVDAFVGGAGTGAVSVVDEPAMARWSCESPDSHGVSAVLAVGLFRRLYPAAGTTIALVGLDAMRVSSGDVLPEETIDAGATAVVQLLALYGGAGRIAAGP
jgi:hydrogenase maturation protease